MESTRRFPVPFDRTDRRAGRGHLVPKLGVEAGEGFLVLPGLRPVDSGMVGYLGAAITSMEVLERWTESAPLPVGEAAAVAAIDAYIRQLQAFKVGTILTITYGPGGFLLTMIAPTPHFDRPVLPQDRE